MANLEIAQIKNAALKAAALEVDETGKKDGYIDSSEINLFTEKATALLNEKKCTAQEFATLFATKEVDKTNTTDVFAKVDSLHNAKNTPEALAKEDEEAKRAEKQEKIKEIKAEIAENDKKLKLYEERLAQKEISWDDYKEFHEKSFEMRGTIFGITSILTGATGIASFLGPVLESYDRYHRPPSDAELKFIHKFGGVCLGIAAVSALTLFAINKYKKHSLSKPEGQEKIRNAYKEAYLKVSQENEQLKAQLAELQK